MGLGQQCHSFPGIDLLHFVFHLFSAVDKQTNEVVALKKIKTDHRRDDEGFPITAIREIQVLGATSSSGNSSNLLWMTLVISKIIRPLLQEQS